MTRDDVIRMAREAGIITNSPYLMPHDRELHSIEHFAALVAAAEREACAKVCDELQDVPATEPRHCAEDIRARSKV